MICSVSVGLLVVSSSPRTWCCGVWCGVVVDSGLRVGWRKALCVCVCVCVCARARVCVRVCVCMRGAGHVHTCCVNGWMAWMWEIAFGYKRKEGEKGGGKARGRGRVLNWANRTTKVERITHARVHGLAKHGTNIWVQGCKHPRCR